MRLQQNKRSIKVVFFLCFNLFQSWCLYFTSCQNYPQDKVLKTTFPIGSSTTSANYWKRNTKLANAAKSRQAWLPSIRTTRTSISNTDIDWNSNLFFLSTWGLQSKGGASFCNLFVSTCHICPYRQTNNNFFEWVNPLFLHRGKESLVWRMKSTEMQHYE